MLLSEVEAKLKELREKYGDVPVVFFSNSYEDGGGYTELSSWEFHYKPSIDYRVARGIYDTSQALVIE